MLFFFPRGILDEILNLIESVSEGFPSYFYRCLYMYFALCLDSKDLFFLDIKGVSTPPTFSVFHMWTISTPPPPPPHASACHSHIMCIMIIITYMESGLLRHGGGESTFKNLFLFPLRLIIKCGLFH